MPEEQNPALLIALGSALGALISGGGFMLTWGRKVMSKKDHEEPSAHAGLITQKEHDKTCPAGHHVLTDYDHEKMCSLKAAPLQVEIEYLKTGQQRLEKKVDGISINIAKLVQGLPKQGG